MDSCFVLLCGIAVTTFFAGPAGGLQITDLKVPQLVRNDSGRPVLLDCEYTLTNEEEAKEGLVVKWFFNSQPAPVYQWIPGKKPQDLGILKGRVNLEYKASKHAWSAHRALQIVNPTTELSGDYKCSVSTFHDEDFMVKRMLVFAPEKRLEVWHTRGPSEGLVNVTCFATGSFPEPSLTLSRDPASGSLEDVRFETRVRAGSYEVTASAVLEEPAEPADFHCVLRIPDARYEVRKSYVYYPGMAELNADNSGCDERRGAANILEALLLVALLYLGLC